MSHEADPAPAADPRWLAAPAAQLAWLRFGEDAVVYHRPSGKTHFLNAASAQLIGEVLAQPRSARSAAMRLADGEVDDAYVETVAGLLQRLSELGLVTRYAP